MDSTGLLSELGKIADKLEIEIRFEDIETAGGFCTIKGKKLILINRNLQIDEQVEILLNELARQKEIEDIFILPAIRNLLDERR